MNSVFGIIGSSSNFMGMYLNLINTPEFAKLTNSITNDTPEVYSQNFFKNAMYKAFDPYFAEYAYNKQHDVIFKDKTLSSEMKCKAYIAKALAYFFKVHYEDIMRDIPVSVNSNFPILCKQMSEDLYLELRNKNNITTGSEIYDNLIEVTAYKISSVASLVMHLYSMPDAYSGTEINKTIVEFIKQINTVYDYTPKYKSSESCDDSTDSDTDSDSGSQKNDTDSDSGSQKNDTDDKRPRAYNAENDRDKKRPRKD